MLFDKSLAATRDTAYRADIDGLRAVSILLVVAYHALPAQMPGGFIGVDIFFVISGYLITGIIATEIDRRSFSARDFYARRVRRIFPALIVVLLTTFLIGWFVLLPDAFSLLGQNIAAGVGFVSNLFQLSKVGYFAPGAADSPCCICGRSASKSNSISSGLSCCCCFAAGAGGFGGSARSD